MEGPQHQAGQGAASAGRPDASQKLALHELDQDTLNRVLSELEPEALALAGPHTQRACQRVCTENFAEA